MMGQVVTTFGRARVVCELVRRFRGGAIHLSYLVHPAHAFVPSSLISATRASVVSIRAAIDAAFCNARRVTLAGSITPALIKSVKSPDSALKPKFSSFDSRM